MSDATDTTVGEAPPAGEETEVDTSAAISRGVGMSLEAIPAGSPAEAAVTAFKELVGRQKEAVAAGEVLTQERNQAIHELKDTHNVGFSAMAELMGVTSSLVLYLYQRAEGLSAKQIREASIASRKAKEATRETDPDRKPVRKQTPEEKAFRKNAREQLRAFLEEQKRLAAERGEGTSDQDEALASVQAEEDDDSVEEENGLTEEG